MIEINNLKVYSPGYHAVEWGLSYDQIVDLPTALSQPHKVAVLPVFYTLPHKAEYNPEFHQIPLQDFDLVLFTDIEWHSHAELVSWIQTIGVENWLLHTAGVWLDESQHDRIVYRPAWSFNFLRWNPAREDFPLDRQYRFDCLLGARREHRDFVMLGLQHHDLLDHSITTYRDIFTGHWIESTPERIQQCWPGQTLQYPYVSNNLDPAWEVKPKMDNSVSGLVPWEIYNRTWFSVICETLASGRVFLSAEKMGKCLQARRLFVTFAIQGFLQRYRDWGFETFGNVLDESYDLENDDTLRWSKAFDQVLYLCQQNMPALLQKLKPQLDHNHHRLYQLKQEIRSVIHQRIMAYLK